MLISEIQDTLRAMQRQEAGPYNLAKRVAMSSSSWSSSSSSPPPTTNRFVSIAQHRTWRPLIVDWMYKVCSSFSIKPCVIATAAYYIDVAVSYRRSDIVTLDNYQLVALTSLHMAMKLHESTVFPLDDLLMLLRRQEQEQQHNSLEDVHETERRLLVVLDYHLHPPTAHCYAQMYLDLIVQLSKAMDERSESYFTETIRSKLEASADYLIRDAVIGHKQGDGDTTSCPPSVVAYAAMLLALDEYGDDIRNALCDGDDLQEAFVTSIRRMLGFDGTTPGLLGMLAQMTGAKVTKAMTTGVPPTVVVVGRCAKTTTLHGGGSTEKRVCVVASPRRVKGVRQ